MDLKGSDYMLTAQEIATYHREGYVIPQNYRLDDDVLQSLQSALSSVLADNPTILPDRMINTHLNCGAPYKIRGQKAIFELAHDPNILDLAEAVMGPDLILLFTHLFCKPAQSSRAVPWHQDGPFWPVSPLASCTVWLALDNADEANGAMRVIPGSHRRDYLRHDFTDDPNSTLNHGINQADVDEFAAQTIALEPGQVSLHDIGIIHGSAANSSARRRAGIALRYMPATSNMYRQQENAAANWTSMPMEMVRGQNKHPDNNFTAGDFGVPWSS
jgi:hypothetical protein